MDLIPRVMAIKAKRKTIRNKKVKPTVAETYGFRSIHIPFKPYTGFRWEIPAGIMRIKNMIREKFASLQIYNMFTILQKLKSYTSETSLDSFTLFSKRTKEGLPLESDWRPPDILQEFINKQKKRELYEWKAVKKIYTQLFTVKRFVNGLIHRWRMNKCIKNVKNVEDVVTMEVPKKLVRIVDFPQKLSYVFEASTLKKVIEMRIANSDYMFPNPLPPINPFTNTVFTRGQLMSIIKQCKDHGETSWIFDRLYSYECDFNYFIKYFKQPIKLLSIDSHFSGPVWKYREELLDYFHLQAEYNDLPDDVRDAFVLAVEEKPDMGIVKQWVRLTHDFYVAKELRDSPMLLEISGRSANLIELMYRCRTT